MFDDLLNELCVMKDNEYIYLAFNVTKIEKTKITYNKPKRKNRNTNNYKNSVLATLGDSIIKMVLCDFFYLKGNDRGDITFKTAELEKDEYLSNKAKQLGLDKCHI